MQTGVSVKAVAGRDCFSKKKAGRDEDSGAELQNITGLSSRGWQVSRSEMDNCMSSSRTEKILAFPFHALLVTYLSTCLPCISLSRALALSLDKTQSGWGFIAIQAYAHKVVSLWACLRGTSPLTWRALSLAEGVCSEDLRVLWRTDYEEVTTPSHMPGLVFLRPARLWQPFHWWVRS